LQDMFFFPAVAFTSNVSFKIFPLHSEFSLNVAANAFFSPSHSAISAFSIRTSTLFRVSGFHHIEIHLNRLF